MLPCAARAVASFVLCWMGIICVVLDGQHTYALTSSHQQSNVCCARALLYDIDQCRCQRKMSSLDNTRLINAYDKQVNRQLVHCLLHSLRCASMCCNSTNQATHFYVTSCQPSGCCLSFAPHTTTQSPVPGASLLARICRQF